MFKTTRNWEKSYRIISAFSNLKVLPFTTNVDLSGEEKPDKIFDLLPSSTFKDCVEILRHGRGVFVKTGVSSPVIVDPLGEPLGIALYKTHHLEELDWRKVVLVKNWLTKWAVTNYDKRADVVIPDLKDSTQLVRFRVLFRDAPENIYIWSVRKND